MLWNPLLSACYCTFKSFVNGEPILCETNVGLKHHHNFVFPYIVYITFNSCFLILFDRYWIFNRYTIILFTLTNILFNFHLSMGICNNFVFFELHYLKSFANLASLIYSCIVLAVSLASIHLPNFVTNFCNCSKVKFLQTDSKSFCIFHHSGTLAIPVPE